MFGVSASSVLIKCFFQQPRFPRLHPEYLSHLSFRELLVPQPSIKKLQIDQEQSAVSPLFDRSARQKLMKQQNDDEPPATPYKEPEAARAPGRAPQSVLQVPKPVTAADQPTPATPQPRANLPEVHVNGSQSILHKPTPVKQIAKFNDDPLGLQTPGKEGSGRLYNTYAEFLYDKASSSGTMSNSPFPFPFLSFLPPLFLMSTCGWVNVDRTDRGQLHPLFLLPTV